MNEKKMIDYGIPFKKSSEIRELFLNFFKQRAHTYVPSASIAPMDDPSIFFTNSGMNQFKSLFLGSSSSDLKRAVNTQKCLRVSGKHNDLEEVGLDGTHHTFFEMLGNWSFGDYYKKDIIHWAWEFLTVTCQIPKERLFVTIYKNDDEAEEFWKSETNIDHHRILRFDEKDNFWEMGSVGPCGPCTEIHFDKGDLDTQDKFYKDKILGVNGQNERFVEIWNLVFMQYERLADGSLKELSSKHVDTGAGFERLCSVMQNKESNYDTDVFSPIITKLSQVTGTTYDRGEKGVPYRVICDHLRALVFAICDGITPGNEGRGYVIRRILRRASRFAYKLGQEEPCLYKLVDTLVDLMKDVFPDLQQRRDYIKQVIQSEESRFLRTLGAGLIRFEKLVAKLKEEKKTEVPGEDVFLFHDTYGFPVDLTRLIAKEQGFSIDEAGYHTAMEEQKSRARKASKFSGDLLSDDNWILLEKARETKFLGYTDFEINAKALRYAEVGDELYVVLDQTPFYAEAGGQVGDRGTLSNKDLSLKVIDTIKILDLHVHRCELVSGLVSKETICALKASIDEAIRYDVIRNHSATHLLHAALQKVIGSHVNQQGSSVGPERLRFDFTHHEALKEEEFAKIEDLVNEKIRENISVDTAIMSLNEAKDSGAMALFGEKYDDTVRVLTMGDFSRELCGGTHVKRTGDIGGFAILSEASIASSVRRIEAVTGKALCEYRKSQKKLTDSLSRSLKVPSENIFLKVKDLLILVKDQSQIIHSLSEEKISHYLKSFLTKESFFVNEEPVFLEELDSKIIVKGDLQKVLENLQQRLAKGLVIAMWADHESCQLLVGVSKNSAKNFHAGNIVKELSSFFDGKGGGRPDKAQAGLKKKPSMEKLKLKLEEIL